MSTARVIYKGGLRTECTHVQSGNSFITDAPTDNNGKGKAFSPTDTVATALATCMLTVMGIKAQNLEADLTGASADVTKTMAADPRRISKIEVNFKMPEGISPKEQKILEHTARTCPVALSLHPDIEQIVAFEW